MSIDLRCRHDRSVRELAAGMFDEGRGCDSVAKSLGISAKAARKPGGDVATESRSLPLCEGCEDIYTPPPPVNESERAAANLS